MITQDTTIRAVASQNLLLSPLRRKPRVVALIEAIAGAWQTLEDASWSVFEDTLLENASGKELDQWGGYVGARRGDLVDAEYRRVIQARISANRSIGTEPDIIRVFQSLVGDDVTFFAAYPLGFVLESNREDSLSLAFRNRVRELIRDARMGGVAFELIENNSGAGVFRFDIGPGFGEGVFARTY